MKFFNLPPLLADDVSSEKRIEIIRSIGEKADADFKRQFPAIEKWFRDYDAVYLLSFCAMYFVSAPEGIDREATGALDFYHHYLEIMQALALCGERSFKVVPLMQNASTLKEQMRELGNAMQLRLLKIPPELTDEGELHAFRLRTGMMAQTIAVRNWAYPHQLKRVALSLAAAVKAKFTELYKVDPTDLIQLLFDLTEERNDLLNEHIDKMRRCIKQDNYRDIVVTYNKEFPENKAIAEEDLEKLWERAGRKKRNLVGLLLYHSDLKLSTVYSFTLEHAMSRLKVKPPEDALSNLLDKLSYKFGDLRDFDKEHIVLSNPVLVRPFIKTSDREYFSAVWGVMPHIALELLESLIWDDDRLRKQYTEAKAIFLEDEIERLCRESFPNASVHRGSLWKDDISDRDFENDITVEVDAFAVVIEGKSGGVSDPAKRGAPKRLFETLQQLIEEPSDQALRFIDFLKRHPQRHSFNTKAGRTNVIDSTKLKYYLPLGVTFSNLGMISSNLKKLIEAKVVSKTLDELAPSIGFTDLEAIFELLPLEIEKIHYLARRREFEAHMDYEGDELDLLAFYLDNGFNIGDAEYAKDVVMNMSLKSKELDTYFVGSREGKAVVKPALAMTKWWKDLLDAISNRRTEGWVETGFILLNSTQEDQARFERMFKELIVKIRKGAVEKAHNWVLFGSGPDRRRYVIAGYPYSTTDVALRNEIMSEILSDKRCEHARGVAVIGVQIDRLDYPYSVFARRAATDLFDMLSL